MGWTSYYISEDSKNFNRKKELDQELWMGAEQTHQLLKSTMVGSTYYAAVKLLKTNQVVAFVAFTSIKSYWGYFEFSYKEMSEFAGPCKYTCPEKILSLLSPTDDKYAMEWRNRCKEYTDFEKHYKTHYTITGTLKAPLTQDGYDIGDTITLYWVSHGNKGFYFDGRYRWSKKLIWESLDNLVFSEE